MHIAQAQIALLLRIYNTYQIKRSVLHWVRRDKLIVNIATNVLQLFEKL